jgi:hypothetical protein
MSISHYPIVLNKFYKLHVNNNISKWRRRVCKPLLCKKLDRFTTYYGEVSRVFLEELRETVRFTMTDIMASMKGASGITEIDIANMFEDVGALKIYGPYLWMLAGRPLDEVVLALNCVDVEVKSKLEMMRYFEAQGFSEENFGAQGVLEIISGIETALRVLNTLGQRRTVVADKIDLSAVGHLLLHLVSLLSRDFHVSDLMGIFLAVYQVFKGFSAQGMDALAMSVLSMALPKNFIELFKRISLFSGAKFLDDTTMFTQLCGLLSDFLEACINLLPEKYRECGKKFIYSLPLTKHHITFVKMKKVLKAVRANNKILLQESCRTEIRTLIVEKSKEAFREWSKRSPAVSGIIKDFSNLEKMLSNYDSTRRVEPVCLILEGPAGSGKSVAMNQLVDACTRHPTDPKDVYAHTIKCSKDGKDFYDTYDNQWLFVMDDVGQQGVSQFRSLINMVSEVKFPLDCASADLKDTKFFCSSALVFTTNAFSKICNVSKDDCISDMPALWRRGMVFDFQEASLDEFGIIRGSVFIKWYDPKQKAWMYRMPKWLSHISHKVKVGDAGNATLLNWMYDILLSSVEHRLANFDRNQLTQEVLDKVYARRPKIDTSIPAVSQDEAFVDASDEMNAHSLPSTTARASPTVFEWNNQTLNVGQVHTKELHAEVCNVYISWQPSLFDYLKNLVNECCSWTVTIAKLVSEGFTLENCVMLCFGALAWVYMYKVVYPGLYEGVTSLIKKEKFDAHASHVEDLAATGYVPAVGTPVETLSRRLKYVETFDGEKYHSSLGLVSGHCIILNHHIGYAAQSVVVYSDAKKNQRVWDSEPVEIVYSNKKEDCVVLRVTRHISTPFKNCASLINMKDSYDSVVIPGTAISLHNRELPSQDVAYSYCLARDDWNLSLSKGVTTLYDFGFPGLCGALLASQQGGVCGFHVAGNAKKGVAVRWSLALRQRLHDILLADNRYVLQAEMKSVKEDDISGVFLQGDVTVNTPTTSSLVPSPCYGVFPVAKIPAVLNVNGRHTVIDMAKKSLQPVAAIPVSKFVFPRQWLVNKVPHFEKATLQEVILGKEGVAGLNKKSSNGIGFDSDKHKYIDFENGCLTIEGRSEYELLRSSILQGNPIDSSIAWKECLKDELRPPVKALKPRSFRCANLMQQILLKELTMDLVGNLQKDRWNNGVMIGINPLRDFQRIYDDINRHKVKFAADFPAFDGNMHPAIQMLVADVVVEKFVGSDDDRTVLAFLLYNMAHAVVVLNNKMVLTSHSMPSGSFLTALFNSLYNKVYTLMWYDDVCKRYRIKPTISNFEATIDDKAYGDDKITGASFPGGEGLISFVEFLNSIGVTCTNSKKQVPDSETESWEDMTFLKRSFEFDHRFGRVLCPLDVTSIFSTLSYVDKKKDLATVMGGKIDSAQREIFLHPELYNFACSKLVLCSQMCGLEPALRQVEELEQLVKNSDPDFLMNSYLYV